MGAAILDYIAATFTETTETGSLLSVRGAILLSAIIAALFAGITIWDQSRTARRRATLDMLMKKEWDQDYIKAKRSFNKLVREGDLVKWAQNVNRDTDEANNIRDTLNDYEMIAVGIQSGILDEGIYKLWFRSSFLTDFHSAESYIAEVRRLERNQRIFCEFEALAVRWGAKEGRPYQGLRLIKFWGR